MANDIPVKQARSVTSTAASDSDEKGMESTPPSKRKKPEKTTQIQTACMYCEYRGALNSQSPALTVYSSANLTKGRGSERNARLHSRTLLSLELINFNLLTS